MTVAELIELCERRLAYLGQLRSSAYAIGDLTQIDSIDSQIAKTTETRNLLLTLV
jgi:hypothetical protein